MSVDIDEYKRQLEEFTKKAVPQSAIDYQMAIVRQLYMFMVTFTPVDTGALRGNWKVSVGRKPTGSYSTRDSSSYRYRKDFEGGKLRTDSVDR